MAVKKKAETAYEIHGTPTKISATSRCAVKIKENYYTIETFEERAINQPSTADMAKEWEALFNEINAVTDNQIQDIIKTFNKDNKKA